ncbi:MAG TPA: DUF222 domain-containing protein, partial [Candidatus Corynebacterium gallistercoris]|nr:DUF222 domain-containing protein [Candidatus Corynebacterium gallistercoris]
TIDVSVRQIVQAMDNIKAALQHPTAELFHEHSADLVELFRVTNSTEMMHAAFAYAAQEAKAHRRAGSTRTVDYLREVLGISLYQARKLLNLGNCLFAEPEEDSEEDPGRVGADEQPDLDADGEEKDAEQLRREWEEELARRKAEHEEKKRKHQQDAARRASERNISNEKMQLIQRELEKLDETIVARVRPELLDAATKEAMRRNVEDLRKWLRFRVRQANALVVGPFEDLKRRSFSFSEPDEHGNVRVTATLPRSGHALLEILMAPGRMNAFERSMGVDREKDNRSFTQRRADMFMGMLKNMAAIDPVATSKGVASLVVAVSAKDLDGVAQRAADGEGGGVPASSMRFPTNTGADLSAGDILSLGLAEYDYGVVLEPDTGRAITGGRVRRSATVEHKLMLIAEQLICAHPGCSAPAVQCDVHHVVAWKHGGCTDVDNLTLLCRAHHRMNRDQRDGAGGLGHVDVDPTTGRMGVVPSGQRGGAESGGRESAWMSPDGVELNRSFAASKAPRRTR